MNICSLRAKTLDGKLYAFTVADIPVVVGEDIFVLLGRKFSPILRLSTIVIGSDRGIYVGDILRDTSGNIWYVCYESGIVLYSENRSSRRFLYQLRGWEVIGQMTEEQKTLIGVKKVKLKFKYQKYIFTLSDIVGKFRDDMLAQNVPCRISVNDVQQDLVVSIQGSRMYLGDLYRGLPVFMYWGRVCIQTEFGVYDILEKCYIQNREEIKQNESKSN